MWSRVWPRAPQSEANNMSDVVNIEDSISGVRGVVNNNNANDYDNNAINNG